MVRIVLTILALAVILYLLQRLLMPKYMDDVTEGGMVQEYYDEEKDHDVIFIGDCELYENISPAVLWEEYQQLYPGQRAAVDLAVLLSAGRDAEI